MGMTDPIADLLTRIRNGNMAGKEAVTAPVSKIKTEILRILEAEGFIKSYQQLDERNLEIRLKYAGHERVITEIKRVSKPGCRVYCGKDELPKVLNGLGIAIVSTSKGLLTDKDARLEGVGGEVLCTVW
ncbi:30S ribosomal protein S8 [candidate division KSB3 bacterium]|uniref:Small ribosomal subunit protein uS8 n=1 Tax=candidate division KSB3 bacterium TaxID=2044937 RepID=A0A2G6E1W3_9BACT|nr:MAG: 30S ribosomal protein S8 [candidate division KSB3 bacterium]PIE28558.1 MAG: 30S ribosomal protein S8 [candidate division KSB3 bacterium]